MMPDGAELGKPETEGPALTPLTRPATVDAMRRENELVACARSEYVDGWPELVLSVHNYSVAPLWACRSAPQAFRIDVLGRS